MQRLATRLDRIREAFEERTPDDALAVIHRATADLEESDILAGVAKPGDMLPPFELTDTDGHTVRSSDLLAQGPLVLNFNRGHW